MRILKLSIGNAVLQQRHIPYIAVSAGLIHATQFHLPRTVATVLNQGLGYGFNLKIRVFIKIMNSLCPPSKKMVHIALYMSFGWSVYLDRRFPTACETYNKDRLTPWTSTWYPHFIEDLYCSAHQGGEGNVKIITDFVAAGGEGVMFTFTKISIVVFVKMRLLQNGIFLDLFVGLSSYFHCCIVKCCFMWIVIMCVYYTVPFVTSLIWRFKIVWLRITDEHTVVANSPATCGSHREETLSPASSHYPHGIRTGSAQRIFTTQHPQYTYNGHCWSLKKDFLLWITVKICYDNTGNVPYKGRNFNTQTFGKNASIYCLIMEILGQKCNFFIV